MARELLVCGNGSWKGRLGERIGGRTWWDRKMRFGSDGLLSHRLWWALWQPTNRTPGRMG